MIVSLQEMADITSKTALAPVTPKAAEKSGHNNADAGSSGFRFQLHERCTGVPLQATCLRQMKQVGAAVAAGVTARAAAVAAVAAAVAADMTARVEAVVAVKGAVMVSVRWNTEEVVNGCLWLLMSVSGSCGGWLRHFKNGCHYGGC